jgi:hypothetical protein
LRLRSVASAHECPLPGTHFSEPHFRFCRYDGRNCGSPKVKNRLAKATIN